MTKEDEDAARRKREPILRKYMSYLQNDFMMEFTIMSYFKFYQQIRHLEAI